MIDQLPLAGPANNDANRFRVGIQLFNETQRILKQLNDFTTDLGDFALERDGGTDIQAAFTLVHFFYACLFSSSQWHTLPK